MTESWFVMASERVTEGNISEFMKANPNVDPSLGLVRFLSAILIPRLLLRIARVPQLGDVTNGLIYMHDQDVVHGNLKGVRFQTP